MADAVQSHNPTRRKKLSQSRLLTLFIYDGMSGILSWKVRPGPHSKVRPGDRAGCLSGLAGYRIVKFDGVPHYEHRVIWTLVYGSDPDKQIDHINGDKADNRLENLREATGHQNRHNVSLSASNTSGFKGVVWNRRDGNWRSGLRYKGKYLFFGYFEDRIEAAAVYNFNSRRLLGEFARVNPIPTDREIVNPRGAS